MRPFAFAAAESFFLPSGVACLSVWCARQSGNSWNRPRQSRSSSLIYLSIMLTGRFVGHGRGGEISFVFGRQFDNTLIMMICTRPTISFSFRNTPFIHAPFTDGQFELCEEIQTQSRDLDMYYVPKSTWDEVVMRGAWRFARVSGIG